LKKIISIIVFVCFSLWGSTQCFTENTTFKPGEKISYEVYYNWGVIWLNAGWVTFEVGEKMFDEKRAYFFNAAGESHKNYDWIFKVRDYYQAYLDQATRQPLYFNRKNYEGGYRVHNIYKFDHYDEKIYSFTENSDEPYQEDTLELPPCTFDLLNLVYYTRNIDFSGMTVNDTIPLHTIIDNEFYDLYVRYLGKETITLRTGETYTCNKFSALLVEGTIFKGGEDMFVWVTDDKNNIPVLVEAKILVGSVKAVLVDTKGLRHEMEAKISD
jgi:hypothetical protein